MATNRQESRGILTFAVLAIVFFAHVLGFLKPVEAPLRTLFAPVLAKIYGASIPALLKISKQELYGQYQQCLAKQNQADYYRAQTQTLQAENESLRVLSGFMKRSPYQFVNAEVIGKSGDIAEQKLLINAGAKRGLALNQPVVVGEGQLIGKIVAIDENFAWTRLLSDSRSKVAALILNSSKSNGVVEGGYGLSIKMDFIPRNETVSIGDQVITSGLENNLPKGLLVGTVAALENEAYKPFQQAIITPAANLDKIDIVSVIVN